MTERDVPTSGTPAGPALRPGWEKARSDEGDRPRRHGAATSGVLSALDSWQGRGSGLAPNRAAALAYLAGPFSGALFLVLDEDDPYVRFHAM